MSLAGPLNLQELHGRLLAISCSLRLYQVLCSIAPYLPVTTAAYGLGQHKKFKSGAVLTFLSDAEGEFVRKRLSNMDQTRCALAAFSGKYELLVMCCGLPDAAGLPRLSRCHTVWRTASL